MRQFHCTRRDNPDPLRRTGFHTAWVVPILMLATAALLTACLGSSQTTKRDEAMRQFENLVRWGKYDAMIDFIHPDYLTDHPISSLELRRLQQYQVSSYRTRSTIVIDDGKRVNQVVELRLYNLNTAHERTVLYRQNWALDKATGRWLLYSGLPDLDSE